MSGDARRPRHPSGGDEPDEWLLDAARRAGHRLPVTERPSGTSAWRMLLSAGLADEVVLELACAASGADPADFTQLSPALADVLSHGVALRHRVAPLGVHRGTLAVATSNPRNPELERDLAFAARQRVRLYAASPTDVIRAQGLVYGAIYDSRGGTDVGMTISVPLPAAAPEPRPAAPPPRRSLPMTIPDEALDGELILSVEPEPLVVRGEPEPPAIEPAAAPAPPLEIERIGEDAPVVAPKPSPDVSARLIATAVAEHASEVILEPAPDGGLLVRLCVGGTVNDRFRIPEAQAPRLVQVLKQSARLDVARTTVQRGRATIDSPQGPIVVRVSTEPVGDASERVSLRLFTPRDLLDITQLGFGAAELQRVQSLLGATSGLLVVAGPPGAGVTTTTYAMARALRDAGRRVSTVESLVEYPLAGIAQAQVAGAAPATTASAVRAALASEGDAVLVAAPLDAATLQQQGRSPAMRSRLVIASLDTADLESTLGELQTLHADRARLGATLAGVVVQRLLRRLCSACAAPQEASELPAQQQRLLHGLPMTNVRRAMGCAACHGTGYLGRVAIAQIVLMTPGFRVAIRRGASSGELARLASDSGAPTLWASGLDRVLRGVTSLAELVDTVTPPTEDGGSAPQEDIDALLSQLLSTPAPLADARGTPELVTDPAEAVAPRHSPVASFTLLPPEPGAPAPRGRRSRATAARVTPAAPVAVVAPAAPPRMPCVLLVDDDAAARRALAQALAAEGLRVLQASDGASALAFARKLRPDVILTEVALPMLDAIGLLAALAAEASPPPVVVHTDQGDEALHAWLMECGARTVLRRGIEPAALARELRECTDGVGPG